MCSVNFKPSEALRFLGAVAATVIILGLITLRVTSGAPAQRPIATAPPAAAPRPATASARCDEGPRSAAVANALSLKTLSWAPFRRPEVGWETYAPLIGRELATACTPDTPGFAAALAIWQSRQGYAADGVFADAVFMRMRGVIETRRPFVRLSANGVCPDAPDEATLAATASDEGYGGKAILLQPAALAAYRAMAAAARLEDARIAADPRNLTIFSGYRSPDADSARCGSKGNCDNLVRATCSAHRTGLALDLYVGQAPGFGPDSSADPNRRFMSQTPTYHWLVANADRYGFAPYPFEPWHWEWTGGPPGRANDP